jgi:AcrR family transcriptional regulator
LGSSDAVTIISRRNFVNQMTPRKYDMSRRSAAVAQTRRRIIDATRALHTERGIAATSWDDIAARAGVGVGTVYRHFPTLDDLVPACSAVSQEIVALPDPAGAPALFAGAATPRERIERLVGAVFAIYERGAPELRVARNEPGAHASVAEVGVRLEATLGALVDAAVAPLDVSRADRAVVRALLDLGTWQALREQGLGPDAAVEAAAEMLTARIAGGVSRAERGR